MTRRARVLYAETGPVPQGRALRNTGKGGIVNRENGKVRSGRGEERPDRRAMHVTGDETGHELAFRWSFSPPAAPAAPAPQPAPRVEAVHSQPIVAVLRTAPGPAWLCCAAGSPHCLHPNSSEAQRLSGPASILRIPKVNAEPPSKPCMTPEPPAASSKSSSQTRHSTRRPRTQQVHVPTNPPPDSRAGTGIQIQFQEFHQFQHLSTISGSDTAQPGIPGNGRFNAHRTRPVSVASQPAVTSHSQSLETRHHGWCWWRRLEGLAHCYRAI